MEDSATEAEIRHNGTEAEVLDAKAEAELAETERLLGYARLNAEECADMFMDDIPDLPQYNGMRDFIVSLMMSKYRKNEKWEAHLALARVVVEMAQSVNDFMIQWAKNEM